MSRAPQTMPSRLQKYLSKENKIQEKTIMQTNASEETNNMFFGEVQEGKHVDQVLREYFPDYSYKYYFPQFAPKMQLSGTVSRY